MDFEFPPEVDKLDSVPEPFRPLYVAGDGGKAKLGETFTSTAQTIAGLSKALKAERKNKPDLSVLSEFGSDPSTIATTVKGKLSELAEQLAQKANINPEKIKKEFAEKHGEEITKLTKRNEGLQGQLYKLLVDGEATKAIAAAKGIPDLVLPFVRNSIKVVEEGGGLSVVVVDSAGDRMFNHAGQPMSVTELVAKLKVDPTYRRLFDADDTSGGGTRPANPAKSPVKTQQGELSAMQKIQQGLKAQRNNRG